MIPFGMNSWDKTPKPKFSRDIAGCTSHYIRRELKPIETRLPLMEPSLTISCHVFSISHVSIILYLIEMPMTIPQGTSFDKQI